MDVIKEEANDALQRIVENKPASLVSDFSMRLNYFKEYEERLCEVEIKIAKLWDLLTERSKATKQIKSSGFANRVFKGKV